jgi:alpha-tubulin suppressor-like RCC1 family protein
MRTASSYLAVLASLSFIACDQTLLTDAAAPPVALEIVSGDGQAGPAGQELPDPLVVRALDDKGRPVKSQIVNFVVLVGGGSMFAGTSITDNDGLAQDFWTLGPELGENIVEARAVDPTTGEKLIFARFTATAVFGFVSISAGGSTEDSHTCGIGADQKAYCWGKASRFGQLGTGAFTNSPIPVAVVGGFDFGFLETGGYYTCGVIAGGDIYCWGYNTYGQLGDGTRTTSASPVPFAFGGLGLTSLHVGGQTTCGIDANGAAYCWGWGRLGERGDGVLSEVQTTPVAVLGSLSFTSLEIGPGYHTCGVTGSGQAYCWGNNGQGQVGTDVTTGETCSEGPCASIPLAVQGGVTLTFVEPGGVWAFREHTCGLAQNGSAYCWGSNDFGQLGDGTTTDTSTPTAVSGGLSFTSLSTHGEFACGLTANGQAYCWGHNDFGQLGDGTTTDSPVPVTVSGGLSFASVDAGAYHACGLTSGGQAYCWGRNNDGQLGNGSNTDSPVPVPVTTPQP